jgi:hypothetical protein
MHNLPDEFQPYQDIWVRGQLAMRGSRTCARRYKMIHDALAARYRPGFSTVDLGSSEGYFSIRLAEDFATHATLLENKSTLETIVSLQGNPQLILNSGKFNQTTLKSLGHFDVAIALSILHHFQNWGEMMLALLTLADTIVIELPASKEKSTKRADQAGSMLDMLQWYRPEKIGEVAGYGKRSTRELFILDFPTPPSGPNLITGRLASGRGSSERQKKHYLPSVRSLTGREILPGTVNIHLKQDVFLKNGRVIDSAKGPYHIFPCRIEGLYGWVVKPPRAKNRPDSLEILCDVSIRDTFALKDKQRVRVELFPEHLGAESDIAYQTKPASAPEEPEDGEFTTVTAQ